MKTQQGNIVKILVNEVFSHRKAVVTAFVVVNLVFLAGGLLWPKTYTASVSLLVEDERVIQPLMQGAAVTAGVTDRARLAREVIFGRKIMNQIMEYGGWMDSRPELVEQDKIIDKIIKRTNITNIGKNIIKIEYKDDNADRTYKVTQKLAELFIAESITAKAAEIQSAYEFIDRQTQEYHDKLVRTEEQLKEFRSSNMDAQPGSDSDISVRLKQLQQRIRQLNQEMKEARVKKAFLESQLSGEAQVVNTISREGQFRARIAELQSRLETLRLSYLDTYPDIVQIKQQIEDLNQAIAEDRQRRLDAKAGGKTLVDEGVVNNPVYLQIKQDLSNTQINIEMLNSRIEEANKELDEELERGRRVQGGEAALAELTRDYQVDRDIYQDLLRRRESARVSVNLDKDRQGLTINVQEPAVYPRKPKGLRFMHFVFGGLVLGIVLPVSLLYAGIQLDRRVRSGEAITDKRKVQVLAVIPHLWLPGEVRAIQREMGRLSLSVMAVLLLIVLAALLRVTMVI